MPRLLLPLLALVALLCAAPLYAQDDTPDADHALVGTWMGLTMDGEELEEGDFVLIFNADDTGSINEGGDRPEKFTYTYDADAQRCLIYFDGDEDDAFPIDVSFDGDTATFAPEDEDVLVARRVPAQGDDADAPMPGDDQPAGAIPPPPEPVDTSNSPLLGRWMLVQFNGEAVPDGLVAYDHRADGTGQVIEEGEPGNTFGWEHDMDRGAVIVQTADGETLTFYVVLYGDLAIYFADPAHGDMRIVQRRMPEAGGVGDAGGDGPRAPAAAPMVGQWAGVSDNGEPVDPDDPVRLVFHADGSGDLYEGGDESDPFAWSYDATAEVCTITVDGDRMKFLTSFDGDTMTFESEDGDMVLVMRRIAADEAGDGHFHADGTYHDGQPDGDHDHDHPDEDHDHD